MRISTILLVFAMLAACVLPGQSPAPPTTVPTTTKALKQEELDQVLASIALYPDDLLSQVLMASTYPIEVVQAQRWVDANKSLKGDALATELAKQDWEPAVKSLCNFPPVLSMMSEKLDWTIKLGNAFLSQRQEVMQTVQKLRAKAKAEGNLESNKEQTVTTQTSGTTQTIVIQSADPQVVYVPTYNPTVIYGTWPYPAYPPYYYYPPAYYPSPGVSFGVGLAVGAAWGYAWGHCDWDNDDVDIDVESNRNVNRNIDRERNEARQRQGEAQRGQGAQRGGQAGAQQRGQGSWQHQPKHRQGAAYGDAATAQRFGQGSSQARDSYRGYSQGSSGGSKWYDGTPGGGQPRASAGNAGNRDAAAAQNRASQAQAQRSNQAQQAQARQAQARQTQARQSQSRSTAFDNVNRGARQTQNYSNRGRSSMGASRPSGGGARGGGGGRGGGRR